MEPDTRLILWASQMHGSAGAGYVRCSLFVDPETLESRIEIEHCSSLEQGWAILPRLA